jgi:hypothetical protein
MGIYFINLESRTDRREQIVHELKQLDFIHHNEHIYRVDAIFDKLGHKGCSKSHIKTLELFMNSTYEHAMIFEDDFQFTLPPEEMKKTLSTFFEKGIPYDVVMLSENMGTMTDTSYLFLKKITQVQTTSGYMVHKSFAPTLYESFVEGLRLLEKDYDYFLYCLDQYWKHLQPNSLWYIFSPKWGKQRAGFSNIENKHVDYGV